MVTVRQFKVITNTISNSKIFNSSLKKHLADGWEVSGTIYTTGIDLLWLVAVIYK